MSDTKISIKSCKANAYHPLYKIWYLMLYRCTNPKYYKYHRYGGRGITVCKRWQNFDNFVEDTYDSYDEGDTLDRIDNDGNYEPYNCRWETRKENSYKDQITPTYQYDLQGKYLFTCESRQHAAEICDGAASSISRACKLFLPYKGYRWSDELFDEGLPEELCIIPKINTGGVRQLDKDTLEEIRVWDTLQEAANYVGIDSYGITLVCKGKAVTAGGYKWAYNLDAVTGDKAEIPTRKNNVIKAITKYEIVITPENIVSYDSAEVAAKATKIRLSKIKRALSVKNGKAEGFGWFVSEDGLVSSCDWVVSHKPLESFDSVVLAAKDVSLNPASITSVLTGKKPSAGGYYWKYTK